MNDEQQLARVAGFERAHERRTLAVLDRVAYEVRHELVHAIAIERSPQVAGNLGRDCVLAIDRSHLVRDGADDFAEVSVTRGNGHAVGEVGARGRQHVRHHPLHAVGGIEELIEQRPVMRGVLTREQQLACHHDAAQRSAKVVREHADVAVAPQFALVVVTLHGVRDRQIDRSVDDRERRHLRERGVQTHPQARVLENHDAERESVAEPMKYVCVDDRPQRGRAIGAHVNEVGECIDKPVDRLAELVGSKPS